jgi:methyltransferase family protein
MPRMDDLQTFLSSIPAGLRRPRFWAIAQGMLDAGRPISILETGCLRPSGSPEQDGCSTLVWDYIAQKTGGRCITIDSDGEHCNYTKSKVSAYTEVIWSDSLDCLSRIKKIWQPIDLLYLDSMDYVGDNLSKARSALHHAGELAAAWKWLAPDAIIAIDDCSEPYVGKHALVKRFFDSIGVEPLTSDYIHTWKRPSAQSSLALPSTQSEPTHTPVSG